jgi:hypothetical protein
MLRTEYVQWSVKLLLYVSGVASTIVGSWVSSKIRLYHDARNAHRDELKQKVLEPLRSAVQSQYRISQFGIGWQPRKIDRDAKVEQVPVEFGPVLGIVEASQDLVPALDSALLADAESYHYQHEIAIWEEFHSNWAQLNDQHHAFIIQMATEILNGSALPEHDAKNFGAPYIMPLGLAQFLYGRLIFDEPKHVYMGTMNNGPVITNGITSFASGTKEQLKSVLALLDSILQRCRSNAEELQRQEKFLEQKRAFLLRKLSLAIAAKKLKHRCEFVTFF